LVLNSHREKADSIIRPLAKAFLGVSPNVLSGVSLVCAALMMFILIIWDNPLALIIAFVFVLLNGFFDAIDGAVAHMTGKASTKGDLVDHVIDRYADFFMIAGISLSYFADVRIGLLALGCVMIASYMGTQSQALGLKRDYGGILGRAERMVLLMVFILLQYLFEEFYQGSFEIVSGFSVTLLDVLLLIFIVASSVTALQRLARMWKALGA